MFFGIEWLTALLKISFQIVFAIITAIPATIAWNCIAPIYLKFIPTLYQHFPYWHVVAIILVTSYVGEIINKLTPRLVYINSSSKSEK